MVIEWKRYRIRSNASGFTVDRRLNPKRWRIIGSYGTLAEATQSLLQYRIRTETGECIVKAIEHTSARVSTARLVELISLIGEEIREAVGDQH